MVRTSYGTLSTRSEPELRSTEPTDGLSNARVLNVIVSTFLLLGVSLGVVGVVATGATEGAQLLRSAAATALRQASTEKSSYGDGLYENLDCAEVHSEGLTPDDCGGEDLATAIAQGFNSTRCLPGSVCYELCRSAFQEGWFACCAWDVVANTGSLCDALDQSGYPLQTGNFSWYPSAPTGRRLSSACGENAFCMACSEGTTNQWDTCTAVDREYANSADWNHVLAAMLAIEPSALAGRCVNIANSPVPNTTGG